MTYEQGGSGRAGLGIITSIGDTLTLKDRIKNFTYKSYVLNGDQDKVDALTKLLDQHEIEYQSGKVGTAKGFNYKTGKIGSMKMGPKSLIIPGNQSKGTLVKVLFEPDAKLSDSVTYDITAWSLPHAYGLDAIAATSTVSGVTYNRQESSSSNLNEKAYAFLTDWNSMNDARFLADLIQEKIRVRHNYKPFALNGKNYKRGTLIITRGDNKNHKNFLVTLQKVAAKHNKELTPAQTGFVDSGKDFGSGWVQMIDDVKVAVLSGEPTSTLRFGEIWHFFEQQLHYPFAVIDADYINRVDLSTYDVLILPGGWGYKSFMNEDRLKDLKAWVKNGGKLIAMGGAISSISGKEGFDLKKKEIKKDSSLHMQPFDGSEREGIKNAITGAIFKTKVDNTHPLAFGYDDSYFSLKLGNDAFSYMGEGNVVYLDENQNKPVSGFAKSIDKTLVFGVEDHGRGTVVYMVDNPLFRGFWENGKLFFANALFMVN